MILWFKVGVLIHLIIGTMLALLLALGKNDITRALGTPRRRFPEDLMAFLFIICLWPFPVIAVMLDCIRENRSQGGPKKGDPK